MRTAVVIEMQSKDKQHITVILQMARLLGICPWNNPSCLRKFHQIVMICLTFGISVISFYKNLNRYFSNVTRDGMIIFTNSLASIFTITQGTSIQTISLLYPNAWKELIEELYFENKGHVSIKAHVGILIINILVIAKHAWCWLIWPEWEHNAYYIYKFINEYYTITLITLMIYVNQALEKHCLILNATLGQMPKISPKHFPYQLRQAKATYRKLLQILNHFSSVFGYPILFIMGNSIAVVLENLHYALQHLYFDDAKEILFLAWGAASTVLALVGVNIII